MFPCNVRRGCGYFLIILEGDEGIQNIELKSLQSLVNKSGSKQQVPTSPGVASKQPGPTTNFRLPLLLPAHEFCYSWAISRRSELNVPTQHTAHNNPHITEDKKSLSAYHARHPAHALA